jgi:hypothetical protein
MLQTMVDYGKLILLLLADKVLKSDADRYQNPLYFKLAYYTIIFKYLKQVLKHYDG